MIAGLSGSLLSHAVVEKLIAGHADAPAPGDAAVMRRTLRAYQAAAAARLGPACGARRIFDLVAGPLFGALGYSLLPVGGGAGTVDALLRVDGTTVGVLSVTGWRQSDGAASTRTVRLGIAHDVRWCLLLDGSTIRLLDAARPYAKRQAEFDLVQAVEDERTFAALHLLLRPANLMFRERTCPLDTIVALCERHRAEVRTVLRQGVHQALLHLVGAFRAATRRHRVPHLLDESLTVVYRILFLLFAEARGLVPRWHPVYRDSYTIEALCEGLPPAGSGAGTWEGLQAIARLAHQGCRAGALRVTPFNGRLFSPSDAPLADTLPLDDRAVGQALAALTEHAGRTGPEKIAYADLGVEQLGGVYEHLLDFDLGADTGGTVQLVATGRRKATGSFYTPRSLTDFLVRRTLAPIVSTRTAAQILELRVLDPAMGSGAFLVAACRYLASAFEQALVREGAVQPDDVDHRDRAEFRRTVARQCLFGVDVNPAAVQLGRLSLWLATLAADKPLSFFDHHLRAGHSLAGTTIEAMLRQPVPGGRPSRARELPLFEGEELETALRSAVGLRTAIARVPDDSLEQVRTKERSWRSLTHADGPIERWRAAADVWCAGWFEDRGARLSAPVFRAVIERVLHGGGHLPQRICERVVTRARRTAAAHRFFHWPLEFPEIFYDERGVPLPDGGFDVILGNPPWEMLRSDPGAGDAVALSRFARGSGIYALQGSGHGNLYQLFVERAFHLLRPGGRCGLVLPAGLASDTGCAALRQHLFARTSIDTFTTVENRDGIFPIHRGLKFLLMTFTSSGSTPVLPSRPGIRAASTLDAVPEAGEQPDAVPIPRTLIERLSGPELAVPELRTPQDLAICGSVVARVPPLADPAGWNARFGRELNATDDRPHFDRSRRGLPVVEGKLLRPFGVDLAAAPFHIPRASAARLLNAEETFGRARLAYREVASATNRLTLIAAVLPPDTVTTHTVFCLKSTMDATAQQFLCGVFNSYVANYFVRLRVGTHVTAAIVSRLPVPKPASTDRSYREIAGAAAALAIGADRRVTARLNALVAALYGLSHAEFAHILETFPLVPLADRRLALEMVCGSRPG